MGFKTTVEHEVTQCPGCQRQINMQAAAIPGAPRQVFSVCVYCGTMLDYRQGGSPKAITKETFATLSATARQSLERGCYEASKVRPAMLMMYENNVPTLPEELE